MNNETNISTSGCILEHFSQPAILQQTGFRRLALLLGKFSDDLQAANLVQMVPDSDNGNFSILADALALTASLPERLLKALLTMDAAAAAPNQDWLEATIQRRFPCVSMTACAVDRALELWFTCPEELSRFVPLAAPKSDEGGFVAPVSENPPIHPSIHPTPSVVAPKLDERESSIEIRNSKFKNGEPHPSASTSDSDAFHRLALLSPAEYDRARIREASRLRIRKETL